MTVRKINYKGDFVQVGSGCLGFGGNYYVYRFGKKQADFTNFDEEAYTLALDRLQKGEVIHLIDRDTRCLWLHSSGIYSADESLEATDVANILWDRQRRTDNRLERLRKAKIRDDVIFESRRERIPEDVRSLVFRRDRGCCVQCGAEDDLQFDHIIPVARGGGNAADNLQILCGNCNRQKSDSI